MEFGPGRPSGSVVDTTLVQNLIENDNLFYSNSFPAGLIGAGDYSPSSVGVYSRVFATASEADVFYNQLNSDYQSYANLLANDLDGDGVVNSQDQHPNDPYRASGVDSDNDGVDDEFDINDNNPNIMLGDIDGDGIDDKNDISLNDGPLADFDNDGIINRDDPDDDNDGILDQDDSEDFIQNTPANDYAYGDSDNDGIANRFDDDFEYSLNNGKLDDDNDGVPNFADADNSYNIFGTDNNNNGVLDFAEYTAPTQTSVTSLLTNFGINASTNVDSILQGLHSYEPNANLGLQKTIDLINLLFKQQTISGGDIDDHPDLIDMVSADNLYAHATSDQFLGLIKEFNLIADSSNEAMVDSLLSALFQQTNGESWIDITFGMNHDPANNNHQQPNNNHQQPNNNHQQPNNNHSDPVDMVANYAHLLDGLLGANRGELKVNDTNERPESLRAANLDFEVKDINFRVISGHTVNIGGSLTDSDDDASPKDVDLTIIASGRDTTLTGNSLSITSGGAQNVTDAYLIASADELYLRSEWTAASHAAHYADPTPYSIDIDNASFAMASIDDMHLINLDITTEGSLAIATLDDLNLRSTKPSDDNIFKVGHQGIRNEGLFLYAKDEMSLSDLRIEGNVDDIYMEATTINLTDVTFPQMSTVLLRSKLKGMTFDGEAYQADKVNFRNVQHLAIDPVNRIERSDFVGHKSTAVSSSGRPRIEVQGWGSSN